MVGYKKIFNWLKKKSELWQQNQTQHIHSVAFIIKLFWRSYKFFITHSLNWTTYMGCNGPQQNHNYSIITIYYYILAISDKAVQYTIDLAMVCVSLIAPFVSCSRCVKWFWFVNCSGASSLIYFPFANPINEIFFHARTLPLLWHQTLPNWSC